MCRALRAEFSPQREATRPDRAATPHGRIVVEVTADRAGTAEAATARPRVATPHRAGIADRQAVRQGDIVAEATPRRRRTAQARSAAAADIPGHMGARAAPMAGAAPTAAAVRMVVAAGTVAIANSFDNSPRLLSGAMLFRLTDCPAI
jgi:hypothetical protein